MIYVRTGQYIVKTNERSEMKGLQTKLSSLGLHVFSYPCISIRQNLTKESFWNCLGDIRTYDIIIFTSKNSVRYLFKYLATRNVSPESLEKKTIFTIGLETAQILQRFKLNVTLIPQKFTFTNLLDELPTIEGKKILLPLSTRADFSKKDLLQKKGAQVTVIPLYKTELVSKKSELFEKLVENNSICCVIFTSPSTIDGFIKRTKSANLLKKIKKIPIFCIGPVTAKVAKLYNFSHIYLSEVHTFNGIINTIKNNIKII